MSYPDWFSPYGFTEDPPVRPTIMVSTTEELGSFDRSVEIQTILNKFPGATHLKVDDSRILVCRIWEEPNPNYEEEIVQYLRDFQAYRLRKAEWHRLKDQWDERMLEPA